MTARAPWFPGWSADARLADVELRLTLAIGLLPLGIALLLMAAGLPDWPSPGLWAGLGLTLAGMGVLALRWKRSRGRYLRGYSTTHFLIRYLFVILGPILLWLVFGEWVIELAGIWPPLMLALLLALYPVGRILRERSGPNAQAAPYATTAYFICRQTQMVLLVFSLVGLISGAVVDANEGYPTDPTALLLALWVLACMALLAGVVVSAAQWSQLFRRTGPPQPLDDLPPPTAADAAPPQRYGSENF